MNKKQLLQAQQQRGTVAQDLLDNPIFKEAFIKIKGDLFNEFNRTDLHSDKQRHNVWLQSQILDKFEANFISIVKNGNAATIEIAHADKPLRTVI